MHLWLCQSVATTPGPTIWYILLRVNKTRPTRLASLLRKFQLKPYIYPLQLFSEVFSNDRIGNFFKPTTFSCLCGCSSLAAPPHQGANPNPLIPTLRRRAGSFPVISFGTASPHIRGWSRVKFCELVKKRNLYTAGGFSDSGRWPAKL